MMMVVLGRLTRCFEFRRPLMCFLNKCWPKSMWCPSIKVADAHVHELISACSLLPLALMDLRTPVSGLVTCSDASTTGGGMCASNGLSETGLGFLEKLDAAPYDSECFRPQGSAQCFKTQGPRVAVISLFDGPSAVMCALTRLPCVVQGYASAGGAATVQRLSRTRFPGVLELGKAEEISESNIAQRRLVIVWISCFCRGAFLFKMDRVHPRMSGSDSPS